MTWTDEDEKELQEFLTLDTGFIEPVIGDTITGDIIGDSNIIVGDNLSDCNESDQKIINKNG